MKSNNEWLKRKRRYWINNNIVCKIFMRLYRELKELLWLGLCVGILVFIVNILGMV